MPDMTNMKDSLYTCNPFLNLKNTFTDKDANTLWIEDSLDGGRQLQCSMCAATKSYSGSSQKLIAEAFHDSGWWSSTNESICSSCVTTSGYTDRYAWVIRNDKPKYDYGCSIVHPYPGSMALNKSQNGYAGDFVNPEMGRVIPKRLTSSGVIETAPFKWEDCIAVSQEEIDDMCKNLAVTTDDVERAKACLAWIRGNGL